MSAYKWIDEQSGARNERQSVRRSSLKARARTATTVSAHVAPEIVLCRPLPVAGACPRVSPGVPHSSPDELVLDLGEHALIVHPSH